MPEDFPSGDLTTRDERDRLLHAAFASASEPEDPLREADMVGYYRMDDDPADELEGHALLHQQARHDEIAPLVPTGAVHADAADPMPEADLVGHYRSPNSDASTDAGWTDLQGQVAHFLETRQTATLAEPASGTVSASDDGADLEGPFQSNGGSVELAAGSPVASDKLNDWIARVRLVGPAGLWLAFALRKFGGDPSLANLRLCHRAARYVAASVSGENGRVAQTLLAEISAAIAATSQGVSDFI